MKEAAELFTDFRRFMHKSLQTPDKITRRTIEKCEILDIPLMSFAEYFWPNCGKGTTFNYKIFNIVRRKWLFIQTGIVF